MDNEDNMNDKGLWGENLAGEYLKDLGYSPLFSNFSWKFGEIDLIMKDNEYIVFIEVRSLQNTTSIHPIETINKNKIRKIKKTAELFLHKNNLHEALCRFDFISIQGKPEKYILEHFKDAF